MARSAELRDLELPSHLAKLYSGSSLHYARNVFAHASIIGLWPFTVR